MKRILAILGLLIFVLAMLVLPAAHTHGACGEHACNRTVEHDASDHNDDDGEKHPDKGQGCSKRGSCCNWHLLVLQKAPEAGSAGGPGYPC